MEEAQATLASAQQEALHLTESLGTAQQAAEHAELQVIAVQTQLQVQSTCGKDVCVGDWMEGERTKSVVGLVMYVRTGYEK